MSLLSFLKTATVEEVKASTRTGGGARKERNPAGLAIRVWKDGSVYPSQEAVDRFSLEYVTGTPVKTSLKALVTGDAKSATTEEPAFKTTFTFDNGEGNGLDVIDSRYWHQYKADGNMLFVAPVPKDAPKVSLFSVIRRDDTTGVPTESVMDQGAATFGSKFLIPALKDVYGIDFTEGKEYIDLQILDTIEGVDINKTFSTPIAFFPKVIARGDKKDQADYVKRENATIYALVPAELINPENTQAAVPAENLNPAAVQM